MEPDLLVHSDNGVIAIDVKISREPHEGRGHAAEEAIASCLPQSGGEGGVALAGRWSSTDSSLDHDSASQSLLGDAAVAADDDTEHVMYFLGAGVSAANHGLPHWSEIRDHAVELNKGGYSRDQLRNQVGHATRNLDADEVSKLLKLVKRWYEFAESSTVHADLQPTNIIVSYVLVGGAVDYIAGDDTQWLREWSVKALPTLLAALDAREFVELVREIKREKTRARLALPRPRVSSLKSQLSQLVDTIVPHAPPARLPRLWRCAM
jgi:hypothetical protein